MAGVGSRCMEMPKEECVQARMQMCNWKSSYNLQNRVCTPERDPTARGASRSGTGASGWHAHPICIIQPPLIHLLTCPLPHPHIDSLAMLPLLRLSCTQSRGEEDEHEAPLKGDGEVWVQGGVGWGKKGVPKAEGMAEEQWRVPHSLSRDAWP